MSASSDARLVARQEGMTCYHGKACNQGHSGLRYVANRACIECSKRQERAPYDSAKGAAAKRAYRARRKAAQTADLGLAMLDML